MSNLTISTCAAEAEHGGHVFEITDYSLHRGIGVGRYIRSAYFSVGGYLWSVLFYPDGASEDCKDYVSLGIENITSGLVPVRASVKFNLCHPSIQPSPATMAMPAPVFFHLPTWHLTNFIKRSQMEEAGYVVGDRLLIGCRLTVIKVPRAPQPRAYTGPRYPDPPSNITQQLGKLLETKEEADVTFKVGEEEFPAHRIVLAMRSPVLKAQLYGPMKEKDDMPCIPIVDMQPDVFRALLHFIYTDSLPSMDDLDGDDKKELTRHLLVAADRYAMDRLKRMCENILRKGLDVNSVATTLALADQHNCEVLKEACTRFMAALGKEVDDVVASQGYAQLKRSCPSVLTELWEKASKIKRTFL
jgi:speckle-type POZ protein